METISNVLAFQWQQISALWKIPPHAAPMQCSAGGCWLLVVSHHTDAFDFARENISNISVKLLSMFDKFKRVKKYSVRQTDRLGRTMET